MEKAGNIELESLPTPGPVLYVIMLSRSASASQFQPQYVILFSAIWAAGEKQWDIQILMQPCTTAPLGMPVKCGADAHADIDGIALTPIRGLFTVRATSQSGLKHDISRPLVCLVMQGSKRVTVGTQPYDFAAGDSLLVTADVPTVSQITRATVGKPYYSLVLELDAAVISDVSGHMNAGQETGHDPVRVLQTDAEVADAALRLMRLLDRLEALPVLQGQLARAMHYWLLAGRHGAAIRRLARHNGHVERVTRAVRVIRTRFAETLPIEQLAAAAGMSISSFHDHFKAVTSLPPLQLQKQLRLIEARRLMQSEGANASFAAFTVGYESISQFTREYSRLFGLPPVKDMKALQHTTQAA